MRKALGVAAVAAVSASLTLFFPSQASADDLCPMEPVSEERLRAHESELLSLVNRERSSRGLQAIAIHGEIVDIAREHARRMASEGRVYHNPEYQDASRVGAESVGEVPANGCSVRDVHDLVMGSPADRSTMLVAEWSVGGVGMASNEAGKLYVIEAFAQPKQASAASPAPVEAAPAAPNPGPTASPVIGEWSSGSTAVSLPAATPAPTAAPQPETEVRLDIGAFQRIEQAPGPASPRAEPHEAGFRMAATGWWMAGLFAWSMLWALLGPGGPQKRWARRLREPTGPRRAGGSL